MWNSQHASKMHPKIRVVDGVSEGEVGLEMHMKNRGERKAQEEITDDDVFKELINIVMDVFSNQSEKCMLTFELPAESGVLKEIPPVAMETGSEVSSNASKSDILIPLKNTKNFRKLTSRKKRKLRVPIAKVSKYKLKKKFKKRFNPIVQTALSTKPGFTRLDRLFWMHPKRSHLTDIECDDRHESITEPTRNTAVGWKDAAERDALLNEVPNLKEKMTYPPQGTDNDAFINLYSEFADVKNSLEELAYSQECKLAKISFGELSYHLKEIQCHIGAIRDSLKDSQSFESVNTMLQLTSTESFPAPKGKNKVGVKLIRIGAKIGRKSNIQIARCSKNHRTHKKYKDKLKSTQEIGLGEILKNYQKVKKEETEIVKVLLGKLGFNNGRLNDKSRKRRPKSPKQELFETAKPCSVTAENIQCREVAGNAKDSQEDMIADDEETRNEPQRNNINDLKPKQLSQISLPEVRRDIERRNDSNHKEISRKNRKRGGHGKRSREITTKISRDRRDIINANNRKFSPIYGRPSPGFTGRGEEQITGKVRKGKIGNATNFMEQSNPGAANNEGRMMHQIHSATKRLEYMHSLVGRKLNRLTKQQKEWNRKLTREHCGIYTPRESRSNEGSQNEVYELPKKSLLNLSTEIEELIFQPYRNVKLDESKNIKETLSCYMNAPQEEVSGNEKPGRHFSSTLETQGSLKQEQFLSKNHQNYICNYMMEIRDKEFEHASTCSMENQRGSELGDIENVFSSTVLTNEFQESSSTNGHENDLPTSSLLSVTTKENEGEIIKESLFANQPSPNKNVQKPTDRKKKKRVIYTPLCTLS